jgi:antitoxin CcdA
MPRKAAPAASSSPPQDAIAVALDAAVVTAARAEGLNVEQVAEAALRQAAKAERERRWQEENRAAIEAHNDMIRREGLFTDFIPGWWNDYDPPRR